MLAYLAVVEPIPGLANSVKGGGGQSTKENR